MCCADVGSVSRCAVLTWVLCPDVLRDMGFVSRCAVLMRVSPCFAEEAVNEVKRQAMAELQKAVSEAERKAHDMITSERAKMERTVAEAKRQAAEDALAVINQQEDSSEVRALLGRGNLCLQTIDVSELALICVAQGIRACY